MVVSCLAEMFLPASAAPVVYNNANICIARLKQNSSGALMAQTKYCFSFCPNDSSDCSSDCEVPSAECCSCPSDSEAAGHSRSKMSSARHRGDRHTVSSQVWWRQSVQTLVDNHRQLVDDALANRKPVKFTQDWRDVVELTSLCRDTSCGVLNSLQLLQQAVVYTVHCYSRRLLMNG